jgi:hypothetical protein
MFFLIVDGECLARSLVNATPADLTKALKALLQFYPRDGEEEIWIGIHALRLGE